MPYPMRCSFKVPGTSYTIEVDLRKWDCNREPPHCHLCDSHGSRIAQIWLNPCIFEEIPKSVSGNDESRILKSVEMHRDQIKETYEYNSMNGAD